MSSIPTIMISSTFYDLKQVRQDIGTFLGDQLGYQALLSEWPSFPVSPDLDTIANCQRRVQEHADVLVLVVGGRYGSIDDRTTKSITNLEYLAAREKGIPIYVFVENRILNILPIWKSNQGGDFSGVVDTPELFGFVETIRTQHKVWVFPFEGAQDIVRVLRIQFAYRFYEGLRLASRLSGAHLPLYLRELGPSALKTALEKPAGWEWILFFEAWQDEVDRREDLLRDHHSLIAIGTSESVTSEVAIEWFLTRSHELHCLVNALNQLVNVEAMKSFGEPGEPGSAEHIIWTARRIGDVLDAALDWSRRVRLARVHNPFERAASEMGHFADSLIAEIMAFPQAKLDGIRAGLRAAALDPTTPHVMSWKLSITLSNLEPYLEALEEAKARL